MLEYIEQFDPVTDSWSELALTLSAPRSHTCAAALSHRGAELIFVLGGWDKDLNYVEDVEVELSCLRTVLVEGALLASNLQVFSWSGGVLALNTTTSLPADRADDSSEQRSTGRSDLACMAYRRGGWEDGLLVAGGYREAGAWLNTAWWLNITALYDTTWTGPLWERLTNIAEVRLMKL